MEEQRANESQNTSEGGRENGGVWLSKYSTLLLGGGN